MTVAAASEMKNLAQDRNSGHQPIISQERMEHTPAPTIMTRPLPLDYYQDAADRSSTLVPGLIPMGVEIAELTYAGAPMTPEWTEYHSNPTSPAIPERRPSESPPPDKPLPRREIGRAHV